MTSRRPDSFDGLGGYRGRDEQFYGGRSFGGSSSSDLQHWVTAPPDIPGSRNLHPGERTPTNNGDDGVEPQAGAHAAGSADQLDRFAGFGIGLVSLFTENVLAHPCIVIRRQCQINYHARCQHLSPFTVVTVMYHVAKIQGPKALWKGMGSTFIVQGISLGAEGLLSECLGLPRELPHRWTFKQVAGHFILKGLTVMVALPFYAASLVETVQSEVVREPPGPLECLREGVARLLGPRLLPQRRLLPFRRLLGPALLHSLLRYALLTAIQTAIAALLRHILSRTAARKKAAMEDAGLYDDQGSSVSVGIAETAVDGHFAELAASLVASLVADLALYPLETALHRLLVQGTRTIVDDTDGGVASLVGGVAYLAAGGGVVLPINTQYDGLRDALTGASTGVLTGVRGAPEAAGTAVGGACLYRGVGSVLLQYGLQATALWAARTAYTALAARR
ncbi:hypothetical protein NHX12_027557 [Muraenolepis orangiensis]|uniref:Solute carrier family 25 member 46 n=1 Tax=Muraenolepis orangiensis TaxID=630683 RepID=A0A9Q0EET7_9TELE|nr:hypothetical protein NHX12_027557 [Muraenolepis orangiensis]